MASASQPERPFSWRGWVLVGMIICAFIVVPLIITVRPPTEVSFTFAYLILPLVPAMLLAIVAVWSSVRP